MFWFLFSYHYVLIAIYCSAINAHAVVVCYSRKSSNGARLKKLPDRARYWGHSLALSQPTILLSTAAHLQASVKWWHVRWWLLLCATLTKSCCFNHELHSLQIWWQMVYRYDIRTRLREEWHASSFYASSWPSKILSLSKLRWHIICWMPPTSVYTVEIKSFFNN